MTSCSHVILKRTAVFSFEGIGLVIPITDAMREPRKFPAVLSGVMLFLMGMSMSIYIYSSFLILFNSPVLRCWGDVVLDLRR